MEEIMMNQTGIWTQVPWIPSQMLYPLSYLALVPQYMNCHIPLSLMIFAIGDHHPRLFPLAGVTLSVPGFGMAPYVTG